jgi:uncharacterized protein YndB with AHSA1/START domain
MERHDTETAVITREVLLDAACEEVWGLLVDERERSDWLDDDRPIQIVRADHGRSLTWRWHDRDAPSIESTVEITLERTEDDQTVLTVTERRAGASTCSVTDAAVEVDQWDRRLLGLELRCGLHVPALVGV